MSTKASSKKRADTWGRFTLVVLNLEPLAQAGKIASEMD